MSSIANAYMYTAKEVSEKTNGLGVFPIVVINNTLKTIQAPVCVILINPPKDYNAGEVAQKELLEIAPNSRKTIYLPKPLIGKLSECNSGTAESLKENCKIVVMLGYGETENDRYGEQTIYESAKYIPNTNFVEVSKKIFYIEP